MSFITTLSKELFDYERDETTGELLFFKFFELFIAGSAIHMAWDWGFYILRISDHGIAAGYCKLYRCIDLCFGNGASSLVIAGLVTLFCVLGIFP